MKELLLLGLVLSSLAVQGQLPSSNSPSPQVIAGPFQWTRELEVMDQLPDTTTGAVFPPDVLPFKAWSKKPMVYTLRTLGPSIVSKITSKRYAIIGHLKYSDVALGSFLELENWFAPRQPGGEEAFYYSRTLAEAGPLAKIEGSDDGRDFELPFDATGSKTPLSRLVLKLHVMGPGEFEISNVRLVQYSDATELSRTVSAPAAASKATPTASVPQPTDLSDQEQVLSINPEKVHSDGGPGSVSVWPFALASDATHPDRGRIKITASHFAIVGEVRYRNLTGELEMYTGFLPDDSHGTPIAFGTITNQETGPMARLTGTSDWRPFWLPFDSSQVQGHHLVNIFVDAGLNNNGTLDVRNLKLVQYPSNTFPASLAPSGQIPGAQDMPATFARDITADAARSAMWFAGVDQQSFFLGVIASVGLLLLLGGCTYVFRYLRNRMKERELRRIASLDG